MTKQSPEYSYLEGTEPTELKDELTDQLKQLKKQEEAWESYQGYDVTYEHENAERTKDGKIKIYHYPQATLVASVRVNEAGRSISGHEHDPGAQSHRDLETAFKRYIAETPPEQRLLIYEGSPASYTDRDAAIIERADAGLAMFLADKEGVEQTPGEPSDAEVADEMERQGIRRAELALFTTLRAMGPKLLAEGSGNVDLAQLVHHQLARNGIPGFREYTDDEKEEISKDPARKQAVLADMSQRAVEYVLREFNPQLEILGLPVFRVDESQHLRYEIEDPTQLVNLASPVAEHRLGEIGKKVSEFRDRHIFNAISQSVADGKKPFVPYGGSHIVPLRPALDSYFGHPAEIRSSN